MNAADFRRIALSMPGAEEGSHMGAADFRVGGRIFATLASVKMGCGNLMLTPEQQAEFVAEQPDVFFPVAGGWGRTGATHIRLAETNEDMLAGALRTHGSFVWTRTRSRLQKSARRPEFKKTKPRALASGFSDVGPPLLAAFGLQADSCTYAIATEPRASASGCRFFTQTRLRKRL